MSRLIKDATVEMFLKTLELISTFHPYLSSGQLLEVERKMTIIKKISFEKWVTKSFAKKAKLLDADCIEIHTGKFCNLVNQNKKYKKELNKIKKAVFILHCSALG